MKVERLDHIVLTVRDIQATCEFYSRVLGIGFVRFGEGRVALAVGPQRINLHQHGREIEPKALRPTPGSADLCFLIEAPLSRVMEHIRSSGVEILEGPVKRTGAVGPMMSVYFRDPDGNLIEVANDESEALSLR